jgi:hypothetical protein
MTVQEHHEDVELQLEVALALLPLIGRSLEMEGDQEVHHQGNRLDGTPERRVLVREVARRWRALDPEQRRRYPQDRAEAIVEFAGDYVEEVEQSTPDESDYQGLDYDASMALLWRQHVEEIRRRDEAAA